MNVPAVLVVDDEFLIRWALGERLAATGYRVVEAEDGRSATRLFGPGIDAVLLDLRLPDADGVDLLRQFKRIAPGTRVFLMSAYVTPDVEAEARACGAEDVVHKPFDVDDMIARVRAVLDPQG